MGLLSLLLIQMFPQFLAVVAIFLMFATITGYWPAIGFNTWWGLILLYLGGALGVDTWLMKGFFDTVPRELDESATMDGASHAQIFFRILLPLVAPVLAVTGLLAFITTINEFLFANVFLTDSGSKTLVGRPVRAWSPPTSATTTSASSAPGRCSPRSRPWWCSSALQRYIV